VAKDRQAAVRAGTYIGISPGERLSGMTLNTIQDLETHNDQQQPGDQQDDPVQRGHLFQRTPSAITRIMALSI
jgi:hypothetical protein